MSRSIESRSSHRVLESFTRFRRNRLRLEKIHATGIEGKMKTRAQDDKRIVEEDLVEQKIPDPEPTFDFLTPPESNGNGKHFFYDPFAKQPAR